MTKEQKEAQAAIIATELLTTQEVKELAEKDLLKLLNCK